MKRELEEALIRDFPNLYKEGSLWIDHGFRCDDGWEPLLRTLSALLEREILRLPEENRFSADQVKEKFGRLRFYLSNYIPEVEAIVDQFEIYSSMICECCSGVGSMRERGGWLKTQCDECYTHDIERRM